MDNKIYYYMKLKDDFFGDDRIIAMESMKNGLLYSNILLKLYLKSLKFDGKLMLTEKLPYTADTLAAVLHLDIKEMCAALNLFEEMGFVANVNGVYWMEEIQNFVGKSSTEADRIRDYRSRKQKQLNNTQVSTDVHNEEDNATEEQTVSDDCTTDENESANECTTDDVTSDVQMYDKGTPENRDIENRDLEGGSNYTSTENILQGEEPSPTVQALPPPDTHNGKSRDKPVKPSRKPYGKHKHVWLSKQDLMDAREFYSDEQIQDAIDYVDQYIHEKRHIRPSDYKVAIMTWGADGARKRRELLDKEQRQKAPPNSFNPQMQSGYDMDELEQAVLAN